MSGSSWSQTHWGPTKHELFPKDVKRLGTAGTRTDFGRVEYLPFRLDSEIENGTTRKKKCFYRTTRTAGIPIPVEHHE